MNPTRLVPAVALLLLPISQAACKCPETGLDHKTREQVTREILALDDQRNEAADRGDIQKALSYISEHSDFCYVLNGHQVEGRKEFDRLVRSGYEGRKSMTSKVRNRRVIVLSPRSATVVSHVDHKIVLRPDRGTLSALVLYVTTWRKEKDGWRVVQANETVVDADPPR